MNWEESKVKCEIGKKKYHCGIVTLMVCMKSIKLYRTKSQEIMSRKNSCLLNKRVPHKHRKLWINKRTSWVCDSKGRKAGDSYCPPCTVFGNPSCFLCHFLLMPTIAVLFKCPFLRTTAPRTAKLLGREHKALPSLSGSCYPWAPPLFSLQLPFC